MKTNKNKIIFNFLIILIIFFSSTNISYGFQAGMADYSINAGYGLGTGYSGYVANNYIPKTKVSSKPKTTQVVKKEQKICSTGATTKTSEKNELTANSLFGTNGILSLNLIQWALLILLILIVVMLTRKAFGKKEHYAIPPQHI